MRLATAPACGITPYMSISILGLVGIAAIGGALIFFLAKSMGGDDRND